MLPSTVTSKPQGCSIPWIEESGFRREVQTGLYLGEASIKGI